MESPFSNHHYPQTWHPDPAVREAKREIDSVIGPLAAAPLEENSGPNIRSALERPELRGYRQTLAAGMADLKAAKKLASEVLAAHCADGWVATDHEKTEAALWQKAGLSPPVPGPDDDVTIVCTCGWTEQGGFEALREHQADMLTRAGLLIWNRGEQDIH